MGWVKGNHSKIFVHLSRLMSTLRGDVSGKRKEDDASQEFVRKTTKYWIRTEDISAVKFAVLQHLPVCLTRKWRNERPPAFSGPGLVEAGVDDHRAGRRYERPPREQPGRARAAHEQRHDDPDGDEDDGRRASFRATCLFQDDEHAQRRDDLAGCDNEGAKVMLERATTTLAMAVTTKKQAHNHPIPSVLQPPLAWSNGSSGSCK